MSKYTVMVDDNFHYMDEDERRTHGTFATVEEANTACRALVDEWLASQYEPGMTAEKLYNSYVSFGEDPFVIGPPGKNMADIFSAWDYARARVEAICAEGKS
jgi:hypothetical protein